MEAIPCATPVQRTVNSPLYLNSLHSGSGKTVGCGTALSRRNAAIILASLGILASILVLYPLATIWIGSRENSPIHLEIGDNWTYRVVFPDAKSYVFTETVKAKDNLNGTVTNVMFRDDAQHMSTQYFWITQDWFEVKTYRPSIGNLPANSTSIYSPGLELFHVPFHVGDKWKIESTVRTLTVVNNIGTESTTLLYQERQTVALEQISTPTGNYHGFKVAATENGELFEALWFSTAIGQVVYGEFHNGNEVVTQALVSYKLSAHTAAARNSNLQFLGVEIQVLHAKSLLENFRKLYLREIGQFHLRS